MTFDTPNRRRFLQQSGFSLGAIALAGLLAKDGRSAPAETPSANPLAPKPPQFSATARNVIFLFMSGGPSQLDLFDPKPELQKWHGKPLPASLTKDLKLAFVKPSAAVLASPRRFQPSGQCGTEFSDYLPHIASCADDICLLRSVQTEAFNHDPGELLVMTGSTELGRPALGSWVSYGLGSESQDLPAFLVLSSGVGPSAGSNIWSNGFLPSVYQGTRLASTGDPISYLSSPAGVSRQLQRARLDAVRLLNERRYQQTGDAEIAARIASYELAFRMQLAAPELLDFSKEPAAALESYGVNQEPTRPFAVNCLLARRMVERGVRFVMVTHGNWDDHDKLDRNLKKNCDITDRPVAALLKDLRQRGLLQNTLVVWGGEFGRTPMGQMSRPDEEPGRDHHPNCFSMWVAGGGVKGGQVVGKTDDFGLNPIEDKIHVHDLQATILHCLGFDHTRLTYSHMGRNFRLTDVGGQLVNKLLA
jgi:uncharacterized protein DUF1501